MQRRTVLAYLAIAAVVAILWSSESFADEMRQVEESSPQAVVGGMANKFARGMANTATGWLELPKQIYVTCQEEGTVQGILIGPLKGIGMTLARTLAGVGEVATFFAPTPGFYDPFMEPDYVWQDE
ncbi:MAG: exosortase system-associated protein, TIGR04073 family [Geobacteraceae bacterium]|nr:exosortase system-associated protein, TIGR04073 family [Geobacteraceae bacterium]